MPSSADFEFLKNTRFFQSIPENTMRAVLENFAYRQVKSGQRFINQGEPGDRCYIIRSGTCAVKVETEGELHTVGRLSEGDVVGEMTILKGEPRSAHVDAETDMEILSISRKQFDRIAGIQPGLRTILTEILADRLSSRKHMAERTIGKYIVTDIIGQGGYAIVYKGVHSGLNMPVAVKMMKHDMAMDEDFLTKFNQEARTIAGFNHENIIKVYDYEELFRTVFIIMELVEGETVQNLLEREKILSIPRTIDFLIQICSGLDYAHQRGIVHRDIKSANMFVRNDGLLKLLDFGLSCPPGTENVDFTGSIPYMSPEEIKGEAVDQRTDIYSLGITAYEMVTGQRPFTEVDLMALSNMHVEQDIPDPGGLRPDLPEALRAFILKACARKPDQRFQNVKQIIEILQPLAGNQGPGRQQNAAGRRLMTTLHLLYNEDQQLALKDLMEKFKNKAQGLGVDLKASTFEDV
jgi:serine/threonine protein kinase